ncbi:MAG: hypothetical protein GXP60_05145 [Epsilonproteobacteria bacterium]|nr:hypothetical protein [Campylobacterota bacterium]
MKKIINKIQRKSKELNIEKSENNYFVSADTVLFEFARNNIEKNRKENITTNNQKKKPNKSD